MQGSGSRRLTPVRWTVAAIAALGVSACGGKAAPPGGFKMPPAEVGVVTVLPHPVGVPYAFPGQVEAYRSVEVRSRVEGVIDARPFTEGSLVRRGQLLYQLDSVRYAAAYAGALATYDNAARTLTRLQALLPRHAVAQQDVDNAQTAVESAKAALDQARKDLSDTQIRAEIDGRVGRTRLQVGGRVTGPGDLLTTIDQLDPVYVTFRPSSEQVAAWQSRAGDRALITPGSKLAVRVVRPDGSVFPVTGRLDFVSPMLDSATGTQEFRARFANANGALVPGAFVQVRLDGFENAHALTVPQRAVQQGLGRQFVYVVGAGDSVSMRDVQPGVWTGSAWVIDSGLVAGDRVIVDGVQKVGPGMVVKPVPATDRAGAEPMAASAGGARQP
ncbi:MAG TPA: efflux RND transporter periplasmic adaptor subunit [Gemmatimonadaceae bacterium]|nr:efflux RND transporter periplasmic adaptor subunit [Gemmatimonadaceae bacterium]